MPRKPEQPLTHARVALLQRGLVDEARRVLVRLERIEELRRHDAPAPALLAEVRALLEEGERWVAAEQGAACDGARTALERFRGTLDRAEEAATETAV